ncbi:MAG: hypothetical protein CVU89_01580 [Firmicutes bacterium HGW-Firmicutes-14]|nr:MAG: hypothetical protein CVU89_01580 [Firmicutes bacterium HGW-Firmicutes-14]
MGDYLLEGLQKNGFQTSKINIYKLLASDNGSEELINAVNTCDILIISSPLHVDSTPAMVVRAMEIIAGSRRGKKQVKNQSMLAICNCGIPEAHQNHTALSIYRYFARDAGFAWVGGLALGGGGSINGQPLAKLGGRAKNVIRSLDLTVAALVNANPIQEEAVNLMEKFIFPHWLYLLFGNIGWRIQARK